jgi:hypothetical protein
MNDTDIQEGFARLENLIDKLANLCVREFKNIGERFVSIDERFAKVDERFVTMDKRFDVLEGKMDSLARRMDDEVEQRHVIGERVSKLEKAL